jgi:hypothetical protein
VVALTSIIVNVTATLTTPTSTSTLLKETSTIAIITSATALNDSQHFADRIECNGDPHIDYRKSKQLRLAISTKTTGVRI